MKISQNLLQNSKFRSREIQVISSMAFENNRMVEDYFIDFATKAKTHRFINDPKGLPIYFDEFDSEWLSPTFIRNKKDLYGFSLIEKSNSTKLFFTKVQAEVDFKSFEPIGRFYAKDNNCFYYGPGGKIIREDTLDLFYDETYKKEWNNLHPETRIPTDKSLWNSEIAISNDKMYWKGMLKKDIHPSLKRITQFVWMDNHSVYEYDLQRLKKIDKVDRQTVLYKNFIKNGLLISLVTDINKPITCYIDHSKPDIIYDFELYKPLFEPLRGAIHNDYWWYQIENKLKQRG